MRQNGARPNISIVINTLNREASLQATLESFRWLRYAGRFEVIVVNGPSTDNSDEVIASWGKQIRSAKCPVANLSVSRNIGICLARGEIVAFIDDDAIPEPEWLEQLATAYEDPLVGAAGGRVFDHTGYTFQSEYCIIDRFARADYSVTGPTPHLSYPNSLRFPHLLGANSSFRTSALLEIGGFDEEFEYFLDETDVCTRIVDAGYQIAQLSNAYVHHKFAPSNIRGHNRLPRYRYPIIKNKIYFTLKHARAFFPLDQILGEQSAFVAWQREEIRHALDVGLITEQDAETFERDANRAITTGLRRGFEGPQPGAYIDQTKRDAWPGEFLAFETHADQDRCTLVLLSRSFPPERSGGIATFSKDLAQAYAARGNIVHVIAESPDITRVDFENGVWVHRMLVKHFERPLEISQAGVPQDLWNWSATAHEEARRIASHHKIDVVEAPIWDCEGVAFLIDRQWPLITSLQTTLHFWLDTHPELRNNAHWMAAHGTPVLRMEQRLMQEVDAIHAISQAIRSEIERAYNFRFDMAKTSVIPLGLRPAPTYASTTRNEAPVILFVGRLEARKGIDVLLQAIPQVLEQAPNVRFKIVGDKSQPSPSGPTYVDAFLDSTEGRKWRHHVDFAGHVDDVTLRAAYNDCDIFVAPSRFESFGLVFLEAMRAGKPVIGCDAGGMPEVVDAGVSGLLVPPGNSLALAEAIVQLVRSANLRQQMGEAGRTQFAARFTMDRMAANSVPMYRLAVKNYATRRCVS